MKRNKITDIAKRVNKGFYDTEAQLLTLRKNAISTKNSKVLDAVSQRLKIVSPKVYQRLIGPLYQRNRNNIFNCYCNHPASLERVFNDIISNSVPKDALCCNDCWKYDLSTTWGYYGWASKRIPQKIWDDLCESRSYDKFVDNLWK